MSKKVIYMKSDENYWVILIVGLVVFICIDFIWIIPNVRDIGVNLLTDAIFSIFTIVFLSWLFNYRDNLSWKAVKHLVFKRINKQIFGIFTELANLCKCTRGGGVPEGVTLEQFQREIFFKQLEELDEKVELNEIGRKYLVKETFASLFEKREEYLNKIEMKYSKFLPPMLVESLMVIQDNLHSLSLNVQIREKTKSFFGFSDEEYFRVISAIIQRIIKEIYKIQQLSEIEIYPEQA